jgi:hypothetical protein
MPQSVRQSLKVVAQACESVAVHQLVRTAVLYLIGKLSESDLKSKAREAQLPVPTFLEAVDCLCWVLCEAVRCKCTADQFREFIAETSFLNTPQVLAVYSDSVPVVAKCLAGVAPDSDHFVRLDWRVQVEFARRALRAFRRPHVVMDLRTGSGSFTVEATPAMLAELHDALDGALQGCRTAQFRRIQRFVK